MTSLAGTLLENWYCGAEATTKPTAVRALCAEVIDWPTTPLDGILTGCAPRATVSVTVVPKA